MSQFTKLKTAQLEVGEIYVAYSGRNKMLSSNGDRGRLVKLVSKSDDNARFVILGTDIETGILKLNSREDAWVYSPNGAELKVAVRLDNPQEGPKFSPRMIQEGWEGKEFIFDESEMYTCNRPEDPYYNITLLRHKGDTIKADTGQPYVNNFRMSWVYPTQAPEWRVPRAERMGLGAIELPLPKKPVPPEQAAVIDSLMPFLKAMKSGHTGENTSYIKVSEDLKQDHHYKNKVCHADMQQQEKFKVKYVITLGSNTTEGNRWVKGHASKEKEIEYINYLANYSPYSDAILTKDPEFILKYGYVIDADAPSRIVVGACFATRQLWEKPFRVEAFYALMLAGVKPDAAFMFAHQCSVFSGGKVKFTLGDGDHNNLQMMRASNKCLINFMKHSPEKGGVSYSEKAATSGEGGVDGMWSNSFGSQSRVSTKLADIKKAGAGGYDNALSVEEGIERAADIIDEWMGANGFM